MSDDEVLLYVLTPSDFVLIVLSSVISLYIVPKKLVAFARKSLL